MAVMGDLPWEWVERDKQGVLNINNVNLDWMKQACDLGLKLHVVVSMRELPPWVSRQDHTDDYFEQVSPQCTEFWKNSEKHRIRSPSPAHEKVWGMVKAYTHGMTKELLDTYGDCIQSISPTLNNEFETRYSQTLDAMRDYSASSIQAYKAWQVAQNLSLSIKTARDPPALDCKPHCMPLLDDNTLHWLGFREDFLAQRYIELCVLIKKMAQRPVNCLLHIPEMLASSDHLNSNLFFQLAQSTAVDELVMDSNMMLFGAPASPSVVGLMLSAARIYNKTIHYEIATERVLPCDDNGKPREPQRMHDLAAGAALLSRTGLLYALEASVHSIGVTNLCLPKYAKNILPDPQGRAPDFLPTALVFVPYRIFYSFASVVSGGPCGHPPIECWHESFAQMSFFGYAQQSNNPPLTCPTDVLQHVVIEAWDDLRTRHQHVAVVGDVSMLKDKKLSKVTERILIRYPCVMATNRWHFHEGDSIREEFEAFREKHHFTEVIATDVC